MISPLPAGDPSARSALVIGAGPAGLTAAHVLTKYGVDVLVLETDPDYVGGMSRTVRYKGFHFDIGGHRFYTKSKEVKQLWAEILPEGMMERPRQSRIFYNHRFFDYPHRAGDALRKLGLFESLRCLASYARARAFPIRDPRSFEDWVVNQFGRRLYTTFFKTYTEKVWGISCTEIAVTWAAQRIKGLSMVSAIKDSFRPAPRVGNARAGIKTLIYSFQYPAARSGDALGIMRRAGPLPGRPDLDGSPRHSPRLRPSFETLDRTRRCRGRDLVIVRWRSRDLHRRPPRHAAAGNAAVLC